MWAIPQSNSKYWADLLERRAEIKSIHLNLDKWEQGDILQEVPVTWLSPAGHDGVLDLPNPLPAKGFPHSTPELSFAIVCSQTCDIAGAGPGVRHPFILIAPVINEENVPASLLNRARLNKLGYLFPLPPKNNEFGDGEWFAELRHVMSVSKALLNQSNYAGDFLAEETKIKFGRKLAQKLNRPALGDAFDNFVSPSLEKFIASAIDASVESYKNIDQVRVSILSGTRTQPLVIQFILIEKVGVPVPNSERLEWQRWEQEAMLSPKNTSNLVIAPARFVQPNSLDVTEYRQTIAFGVEGLSDAGYL